MVHSNSIYKLRIRSDKGELENEPTPRALSLDQKCPTLFASDGRRVCYCVKEEKVINLNSFLVYQTIVIKVSSRGGQCCEQTQRHFLIQEGDYISESHDYISESPNEISTG